MEVVNDLLAFENMKIVQNDKYLKFSLDSVLLAQFVTINKKIDKILDIGTGNAPIPLILSTRTKANIVGVEIQKESFDLARKSIALNDLETQIKLINGDIKDYTKNEESDQFDVITCNPPFFKIHNHSKTNNEQIKSIARHEFYLNIEDICKYSKKLLKNGGVLSIVHRPERLIDILIEMKKNNIEPKRMRFIYPYKGKEAKILLVEGRKNGKSGLKILDPLYTNEKDGSYTKEILQYFHKEK